jgi:hypothetical protein
MRWDREDELDLADIGGEAGAATHGASIAPPGRRPKRLDMGKPPCNREEGLSVGTPRMDYRSSPAWTLL